VESLDRRGVGHRCQEVEPGSIRILPSSAVNAYYLRERFLPFGRTRRSEESRALVPQKRLGCIAYFFRLHSARTRHTIRARAKLTNQDTRSYEPPSAVSMHPSSKAKRQDQTTRPIAPGGQRKPCTAKIAEAQNLAPAADRRAKIEKPRAKIKGAHRKGWGMGIVLPRVLAMVNRQGTVFG